MIWLHGATSIHVDAVPSWTIECAPGRTGKFDIYAVCNDRMTLIFDDLERRESRVIIQAIPYAIFQNKFDLIQFDEWDEFGDMLRTYAETLGLLNEEDSTDDT